jgi:serine/threonine-protein kinase
MSRLEMDAGTLARLSKLLDEALERAPAARGEWVDSLGQEFEALKPQLRDLLSRAALIETGEFLNTLPKIDSHEAGQPLQSVKAGDLIGPYRLLRELGVGGMGSVWLAERADGLIHRSIALKLPHIVTPRRAELAERMAREREILASLDHRNIARLFDAGVTADGQPYLALEYVEGRPIDQYCRGDESGAAQPLEARLKLFVQVANAVAYAHGKLVVHRDLKPANILVGANGGVRLLDFGIAKLLDAGEAKATQLTQFGGGAFTPDYASPEQILGEPLTVASDVYSLGVVLYELLAGARPYKLKRDSRGALEDAIVQAEPPRPSELAPPALRKALRGDLDTIVLKALKKTPDERYATVNALLEDVQRYLGSEPVLARPDRLAYRLRKFAARHRLGVGAAALVLLAVLAGAGVAVWQARVAIAERDRAEEIRRFIAGVFEEADPYNQSGKPLSAAELLRRAEGDIASRFANRSQLRIELRNVIASSLLGIADFPSAGATARRAVADATRELGPLHEDTLRARVVLAEVYAAQRDNPALRAELDTLLPQIRAAGARYPDLLARSLRASSDLAIEEGRFADGAAPAAEAFEVARTRLGPMHPVTVAVSTAYVEALLFSSAPLEQSMREADRALKLALDSSDGREDSPRVIQIRDVRVRLLSRARNLKATIEEADRLISSASSTFGPDSLAVAYAMMNTNRDRAELGDVARALKQSEKVMEIIGPTIRHSSHEYLYALSTRGVIMLAARRYAEALRDVEEAESIQRQLAGDKHWDTQSLQVQHAHLLGRLGRFAESREVFSQAERTGLPEDERDWILRMQANVARSEGRYREAIAMQTEAERLAGGAISASTKNRINLEVGLSQVEIGEHAAAAASLSAVQEYFDGIGAQMHPAYAEALTGLARVALLRHEPTEALPLAERADAFWREFDADSRGAGEASFWLASVQKALGQTPAARTNFARAAGILRNSTLPSDRALVQAAAAGV